MYRRKERLRRDARDAAVGVEKERQVSVGYGPLDAEERVVGFGFVLFFVRAFFFARVRGRVGTKRVTRVELFGKARESFRRSRSKRRARLARVRRALAQHRGRLALAERVPVVFCVYHEGFERVSHGSGAMDVGGETIRRAFTDEIVFTLSVAAFVVARNGREV